MVDNHIDDDMLRQALQRLLANETRLLLVKQQPGGVAEQAVSASGSIVTNRVVLCGSFNPLH